MALIVKFMANYFFNPGQFPAIGKMDAAVNDDFLFNQGPTRGLGKIQFHDYQLAYNSLDLPNIKIFKEQIALLVELLGTAAPDKAQIRDIDFLLNLGELFTLVAYGQLLIEKAGIDAVEDDLMDQIFDYMIRDFSKFALQLYSKTSSTDRQMDICMRMIKKPTVNPERFNRIWDNHVYALKGAYRMND
jgi:acyl-CoA dehydrogenase